DLSATVGLGELDGAAIRRELAGRRPLHAPHVTLAGPTDETLRVFHVMRVIQDEVGGAAAATYIVSRTRSADDLLPVLLLARAPACRGRCFTAAAARWAGAAARRWRGRSPPCPRVRCTAGSRSPSRVRSCPRTSACPPSPSGAWS